MRGGRPSHRRGRGQSTRRSRTGRPRFDRVYDDNVDRIYGFFGYRLASREEAEDLTQLTFERALRAWGRFDPRRASSTTWLMAIARNLLIDHYRANRTIAVDDLEATMPVAQVELSEQALGISAELETALSALSDRDRDVIALRFGADLSGPEIATLTGLSVANVHQILSRGLRRLRAELDGAPAAGAGGQA